MILTPRPINLVVVHHSATPYSVTAKQIGRAHLLRGFAGIGYQHIVEASGYPVTGRRLQRVPAQARGHNHMAVGICVVGDNTKPQDAWRPKQIRTLEALLLFYHGVFPRARFCGHRDLDGAATQCPGLDFSQWVGEHGLDIPLLWEG